MSNLTGKDIAKAMGVDSIKDIADATWNDSSLLQDYTDLPSETGVSEWGKQLLKYQPAMNEFVDTLVTRIGLVILQQKVLTNPLAVFKNGEFTMGKTIEEIFVDIASSVMYDMDEAETDVFKRTIPSVKVLYHERNRQDKIKATVTRDNLRSAFTSWTTLGNFIGSIIQSMYNRNNDDEFKYMKLLLDTAVQNSNIKIVKVPKPTSTDAGYQIATKLKEYSNKMTFNSRDFNGAGVMTRSGKEDQFLLLTAEANAFLDVNVLSAAFNMNKADFDGHNVMIDSLANTPNLVGLIIDRDFFRVYTQLFEMTQQYNPSGLWTNYWLHVWQVMSASLVANATAFVYDDGTTPVKDVTSIVLSPLATNAKPNTTVSYTVVVKTSDDSIPKGYKLTTSDAKATVAGDVITLDTTLVSGTEITVTATADHEEADKSHTKGTATITIE